MLMLSKRHLDTCDCLSLVKGKKFREMKILRSFFIFTLFSKYYDAFIFWAVYNCNFGIKLLEEKKCKQSLTQFMPLYLPYTR